MNIYTFIIGGEEDKALDVDFSKIPCKVCGAPSSGYHFGAITCEGCKVNIDVFPLIVQIVECLVSLG